MLLAASRMTSAWRFAELASSAQSENRRARGCWRPQPRQKVARNERAHKLFDGTNVIDPEVATGERRSKKPSEPRVALHDQHAPRSPGSVGRRGSCPAPPRAGSLDVPNRAPNQKADTTDNARPAREAEQRPFEPDRHHNPLSDVCVPWARRGARLTMSFQKPVRETGSAAVRQLHHRHVPASKQFSGEGQYAHATVEAKRSQPSSL